MNRPLITFLVVSHNQELYICEAVEGALAQTYSPLEVMITDDCSKDRTFEIAQQVVAAYKGPHQVRLNRNPVNTGIGGNISRAMELTRGELVVGAAGDDISLPERAEAIYQAWEQSGRRATSIFSSYTTISSNGTVQGIGGMRGDPGDSTVYRPQPGDLFEYLSKKWPVVVGCTHAWSRELFRYFGPLSADLEDLVLSFRTLAIGQLLYVHQPLVKYRRHDENVSFFADWDDTRSFEHREKRLRWVNEKTTAAYDNILRDIETLHRNGRIQADERDRLTAEARRVRNFYSVERDLMDATFADRLRVLADTAGRGHVRCALKSAPRALPRPAYRALYLFRQRLRRWFRLRRFAPANSHANP